MPKSEFLCFFKTLPPSLPEWFGRKPEPESPYAKTRNRLIEMVAYYCGKRFAKKVVNKIPKEIIEKMDDQKIGKVEEKLMLEVGIASKKVKAQLSGRVTEYHPIGIVMSYLPLLYYSMVHKEAIKNAVKKVFSEESLKRIVNS
ncbi:MAG: hypothetical protein ACPL06_01195 [Candidatus Anstonellales archaeon]